MAKWSSRGHTTFFVVVIIIVSILDDKLGCLFRLFVMNLALKCITLPQNFPPKKLTKTLGSLSSSEPTGRTRCRTLRQLNTSLVVLCSVMGEDASEVTYFVGERNVWSETRLKRREVVI